MDFGIVLNAMLALTIIGLVASFALSVASRKFHVEVDGRVEVVYAALPGSNCGACGNPSCFSAAEAIVTGSAPVSSCLAGGQAVADEVAGLLGLETCEVLAVVSARHCGGGTNAKKSFEASGVLTCVAVSRLAGGDLQCSAGCFGYGDCAAACPFDAIVMDSRCLPVVDLVKCTGCGVCVAECPRGNAGLLELVGEAGAVVVRCNAHDKPAARKKYCPVCCIACKKCEKECPSDAIHVIDRQAVVDYEKCSACYRCVEICPQKCIDVTGRGTAFGWREGEGAGPDVAGFESSVPGTVAEAAAEESSAEPGTGAEA